MYTKRGLDASGDLDQPSRPENERAEGRFRLEKILTKVVPLLILVPFVFIYVTRRVMAALTVMFFVVGVGAGLAILAWVRKLRRRALQTRKKEFSPLDDKHDGEPL